MPVRAVLAKNLSFRSILATRWRALAHMLLRAGRGASARLAAVATPRAPILAGLRFAQPSLPPLPLPRRLSTQPRSQRGERGLLFAELKRCRRREDVARLEARLQPLRTTKEWNQFITAHARAGDRRRAFGILDEMRHACVSASARESRAPCCAREICCKILITLEHLSPNFWSTWSFCVDFLFE